MAGQLEPEQRRHRFHAISIVAGPGACAQAKALTGVRLLSVEAPRLPILGCTNPDGCRCRFQHHEDRRAGPRRSASRKSMLAAVSTGNNRRRSLGRRDVD